MNTRKPDYPIDPIFIERWSPRAFTGEPISSDELLTILEAARWAPSSYNSQPWKFVFAHRGTAHWDRFLELLVPFNRSWAKDAAAILILVSNPLMRTPGSNEEVPSHSHSLDAGAASGYLALQANRMGWHVHGMVGFDMNRTLTELNVPMGFRVEAAYAVGRKGDPAQLPEMLRVRETPSDRLPLSQIAFEGAFSAA